MSMTMTEKTLAAATATTVVKPGDLLYPDISLMTATEFTAPGTYEFLKQMGVSKLADSGKVAVVTGHYHVGVSDQQLRLIRQTSDFVKEYGIRNYFGPGKGGVPYLQLSDQGLIIPGDVVVGADAHAAAFGALGAFGLPVGSTDLAIALTLGQIWIQVPESLQVNFTGEPDQLLTGKDYGLAVLRELDAARVTGRAVEFQGGALDNLSMGDRFTLADMALDFGALNAIMQPNEKVLEYLSEEITREAQYYFPDDDATYSETIDIDVETLEPLVQEVHAPEKIYGVSALRTDVSIGQVIIGGCSGGFIDDLWKATRVLKYRKIHPEVRLIIIPGSPLTYQRMVNEGLASIFTELGASVTAPVCGPCPDSGIGRIPPGERTLVTSRGRVYQPETQVWSGSVATAAATAVSGVLSDPRELITEAESPES